MNGEVLIKVDSVSKKFCKDLKLGLLYGLQDLSSGMFGSAKERELRKKEFWAVNDISFEVKRGECLGLLGHNGAGKSTLLKVLTGLISPDKGIIEMNGRVNALIELTAGFNPILTGRENIYNNGAILGLSNKEIRSKFDEIVAFSELEEFIDTPVQYYSSGMKVRLGFSVAVHTEPDVLILDEVLAVGDAGFRAKSFNKMKDVMKSAAVIFVSHSMPQVARICSEVLFMRHGKNCFYGDNIHKGIEMYFDDFKSESGKIENSLGAEIDNFKINGSIITDFNLPIPVIYGEDLVLDFAVAIKDSMVKNFFVEIQITDKDLKPIGILFTNHFHDRFPVENRNEIKISIPNLQLIDGEYNVTYSVIAEGGVNANDYKILCIYRNYTKIKVSGLNLKAHAALHLKADIFYNDVQLSTTN